MQRDKIIRASLIMFAVSLYILIQFGCSPIPPYSLVDIKPDSDSTIVLMPASLNMEVYDLALAKQWARTFNHCSQIKKAIVKEMDQRESKLFKRKSWLLLVGAFAALGSSLYSGIVDEPESNVLVPLGLLSGTSLTASLPTFSQDKRLELLRDKLERIKFQEMRSVEQFNKVETAYVAVGILGEKVDPDGPMRADLSDEEVKKIQASIFAKYEEIEELSKGLRTQLIQWANECR